MVFLNWIRLACLIIFKHELITDLEDRIPPEVEAEYQYLKNRTANMTVSQLLLGNYSYEEDISNSGGDLIHNSSDDSSFSESSISDVLRDDSKTAEASGTIKS